MEPKTRHDQDIGIVENTIDTKAVYLKPTVEDLGRIADRFESSPTGTDFDVFT